MTPAPAVVVSAERKRAFLEALARVVAKRVLREIETQKCDGPGETGPVAEVTEMSATANVAPPRKSARERERDRLIEIVRRAYAPPRLWEVRNSRLPRSLGRAIDAVVFAHRSYDHALAPAEPRGRASSVDPTNYLVWRLRDALIAVLVALGSGRGRFSQAERGLITRMALALIERASGSDRRMDAVVFELGGYELLRDITPVREEGRRGAGTKEPCRG